MLTSALNKAARYTVRGEASVTVTFPPRDPPTRTAQALPPLKVFPALLTRNFEITLGAPDTVAGRAAQVVTLKPKAGAAAAWRLWIDREWNVPLAYEERGVDGVVARRAELVRADKLQKRAADVAQTLALPPLPGLAQALKKALPGLSLPPGFQAVGVGQRPAGPQVILSDGINVLALVLAQKGVKAAPGVASRRIGGGYVWLVGNLDTPTLQAALNSVKKRDLGPLGTFLPPGDSHP
ncbi:transcriptional regulator [Deinococcus irradiatisoli]|uniref:Transcriptional regulator n=2 Tax=Deinococcus irradiatisoli TaxID=2202254 RepID=A0A2Z3JLA5_9DEIO|nr:transcriptional regulator [Deinococcus irradiatisoli]